MIIGKFDGRLGNNLFQYAVTRSVAEQNGYEYALCDSPFTGRHDYGIDALFDLDYGVKASSAVYTFEDHHFYDPSVWDVKDFTLLVGYYQSEKYFNHDKVRQWFTPKLKADDDYDNTCFIHYRAGDYSVYPWNTFQLPIGYYEDAIKKMKEINPTLKFVFVTDDAVDVKKKFPSYEVTSKSKEEDFMRLMSAKYLIISNSSFSWWTAWLNVNNTVIAPGGWLIYKHRNGDYSPKDIKVDRWIWI